MYGVQTLTINKVNSYDGSTINVCILYGELYRTNVNLPCNNFCAAQSCLRDHSPLRKPETGRPMSRTIS